MRNRPYSGFPYQGGISFFDIVRVSVAVGVIVFGITYLLALIGEPQSLWFIRGILGMAV